MRRLAILPLIAVLFLAGCSQITQAAGEAVGVPVEEICTTFDDAYAQYEALLDKGDATEDQIESARDDFVSTLNDLADRVGGAVGDTIRDGAQGLAENTDLQSPETIEAIESVRDSVDSFCG